MTKQQILKVLGPPQEVAQLCDVGIFPGQSVRIIHKDVWKINEIFTVALRLTNAEVILK